MSATAQAAIPRKVTVIPIDPQLAQRDIRKKHLRVAPYCRVSTDKEEQLSSYEAQIEYYTDKINSNPDWTMVRLYADEGITGTSARKRKDFLKMVWDCQKGKIDLVITKSVSRFCRNTLDGLNYVRRLKRYGVGGYFEKENVNTLYMDNEMILTFMMSQAQAESESLSGNVKWGHPRTSRTERSTTTTKASWATARDPTVSRRSTRSRRKSSAGSSPGTCWATVSGRSSPT